MLNRTSAIVLVIGAVAGYALRGTSATQAAQASPEGVPLAAGDSVVLVYQKLHQEYAPLTEQCVVREVRGTFVRCSPERDSGMSEEWRNLLFVVGIAKRGK
jgi:hypothetical protein